MTARVAPDWAALEASIVAGPANSCKVCRLLTELPADGRVTVERLLSMPANVAGPQRLAAGLTAMGYDVTKHSIARHRENHMEVSA